MGLAERAEKFVINPKRVLGAGVGDKSIALKRLSYSPIHGARSQQVRAFKDGKKVGALYRRVDDRGTISRGVAVRPRNAVIGGAAAYGGYKLYQRRRGNMKQRAQVFHQAANSHTLGGFHH